MYIVIHTESTTHLKEREARRLADQIWALPLAGKASYIVVEKLGGERYCVVGDPPRETPTPKRKQIDNPCDRCGFNVAQVDRHDDPLPQHSTERDCFRATYEAAVEEAKNAGR